MNVFEMVVLIVFITAIAGVLRARYGTRGCAPGCDGQDDGPRERELREQVRRLEERVRVLEAIVTSEGYDLRRRFAELEQEERPGAD